MALDSLDSLDLFLSISHDHNFYHLDFSCNWAKNQVIHAFPCSSYCKMSEFKVCTEVVQFSLLDWLWERTPTWYYKDCLILWGVFFNWSHLNICISVLSKRQWRDISTKNKQVIDFNLTNQQTKNRSLHYTLKKDL